MTKLSELKEHCDHLLKYTVVNWNTV